MPCSLFPKRAGQRQRWSPDKLWQKSLILDLSNSDESSRQTKTRGKHFCWKIIRKLKKEKDRKPVCTYRSFISLVPCFSSYTFLPFLLWSFMLRGCPFLNAPTPGPSLYFSVLLCVSWVWEFTSRLSECSFRRPEHNSPRQEENVSSFTDTVSSPSVGFRDRGRHWY